jgi:DNA helicase-2/ATP-dependent DNA helicase PcrA
LIVNPNDEEAFKRIVNYPARNIGEVTVAKVLTSARNNDTGLWEILCKPLTYELPVNKSASAKLQNFCELIESFRTDAQEKNAYEMSVDIVRRSGIMNDVYSDNLPENRDRKENIEELINGIHDFCSIRQEDESTPPVLLADFLAEIALLTDQDTDTNEGERVSLMTVHAAKGLEFSNVFVVGMEEGLFPNFMAGESAQALEEERRLFYVAITRAKVHCFLSYARIRFRFGNTEFANPSRFLHDIDARFLQLLRNTEYYTDEISARIRSDEYIKKEQTFPNSSKKITKTPPLMSSLLANTTNMTVKIGQTVEHERFGIGEVLMIEGKDENAKVTVLFKNVGNKQLLLRFAKLKVVE